MEQSNAAILGFVLIAIFIGMYFLPTIVAMARNHHQRGAIFLLNLLLGWSVVGWVVAIVWSVTNPPPAQTVIVNQAPPGL